MRKSGGVRTSSIADLCCYCGIEVVVRTSNTAANPNRDFYGCRLWSPKGKRGCRFFLWCDEAYNETIGGANTKGASSGFSVDELLLENAELKHENKQLKQRLRSAELHRLKLQDTEPGPDEKVRSPTTSDNLAERVRRLEEMISSLRC